MKAINRYIKKLDGFYYLVIEFDNGAHFAYLNSGRYETCKNAPAMNLEFVNNNIITVCSIWKEDQINFKANILSFDFANFYRKYGFYRKGANNGTAEQSTEV